MAFPLAIRALRSRNYRLFFAGQLVSLTGTWMQSVAQAWLVYRLTGSASLLGLVGFATQLPVFLFAPVGGAIADRHQRHRIIVCTQIVAMVLAFILAGITLAASEVWHIFVLAVMIGTVNALIFQTRQASSWRWSAARPDQRDRAQLVDGQRRADRRAGGRRAARGDGRGRMVLYGERRQLPGGDRRSVGDEGSTAPSQGAAPVRCCSDRARGFSSSRARAPIRALLLLLGLVSLMGMPYSVLMPIFADEILGGGRDASWAC